MKDYARWVQVPIQEIKLMSGAIGECCEELARAWNIPDDFEQSTVS